MKVILRETIESLGIIGSEVNVAKGYARNYLLPQKKALLSIPANHRMMEQERAKVDIQIAKEKGFAQEMAVRLEGVSCKVKAKVSSEDRLYGSVSPRDILDALENQNVTIEKHMLMLSEPIKTVGTFKIPIRIYAGVEAEITVEVVPDE